MSYSLTSPDRPINRPILSVVKARPVTEIGPDFDRACQTLGPVAGAAYVVMRRWTGDDGRCVASYGQLAEKFRLSRRQAMRVIGSLIEGGFVAVERQRDERGGHAPNVFTFPGHPVTTPSDIGDATPSDMSLGGSDIPLVTDPSDILARASSANPDKSSLRSLERNSPDKNDEGGYPPNPPAEPKPKRRQLTSWPDGFDLDDKRRAVATGAGVDADRQWQRFRDYCDANDKRYRDWDAAWRNWVTSPYQANGRAPSPGSAGPPSPWRNGARPLSEWSDDELLRWSPPPGHRGGVPSEVRMAMVRKLEAEGR